MEGRTVRIGGVHIPALLGHTVAGSRMRRSTSTPHISIMGETVVQKSELTKPWRKATTNVATLDWRWNKRSGITGYRANLASLRRKQAPITIPNTIKQVTLTELHAKFTPPNSRPRSRVRVAPTIVMLPNQSTALIPATRGVDGVSNLRNNARTTIARPEQGTSISQQTSGMTSNLNVLRAM